MMQIPWWTVQSAAALERRLIRLANLMDTQDRRGQEDDMARDVIKICPLGRLIKRL